MEEMEKTAALEEGREDGGGRTLEEAFAELDQLVERLESKGISLEESFQIYKKGMEVLKECSDKIDTVEKKMLQINKSGEFSEF